MRKSQIGRKSRLKPGRPPRSRTPVKKRNPKRQKREAERAYNSRDRKRWIAEQPCLVCGALPSVNAHTRHPSSGAGYKGDFCAIAPLCARHETEKHDHGEDTFNAKYAVELDGLTLADHAARIDAEWQAVAA